MPGLRETLVLVAGNIQQTHLISLGLGLAAMAVIVILKRLNENLPGPLLAMLVISLLVAVFRLDEAGERVISEMPRGLPAMVDLAGLDQNLVSVLMTGALAVAAIGLVETMSIGRVIAAQTRQCLDSNQEFIGQDLANIACGLFSGSNMKCVGTGGLSLDKVYLAQLPLHRTPNRQLNWRNHVPTVAGSPCSGQPAGQVPLVEPPIPSPGIDCQQHRTVFSRAA